jgi:hypothetical protein
LLSGFEVLLGSLAAYVRITARILFVQFVGQVHNSGPKPMKTSITLTDENAAGLAWAVKLSGLSLEEIVNNLLADELTCFRPDDDDVYPENTLGC